MTTFLIEKQPGFGETRPGLTIPGQAPFLLIGEGTSEIQKTIISRGLLREYGVAP
jgi:alkylation response protein AidB-like acyl-CoA dehydrogenase